MTAYGAAYLFVHEVYIHRRVAAGVPSVRYLEWLRESHRDHHRAGGEPYGMLLPLVRRRPAAADRFAPSLWTVEHPPDHQRHRDAGECRGVGRGRGCSAGSR